MTESFEDRSGPALAQGLGYVPQGDVLLVCLLADGQAGRLVEHGHALRQALGGTWRVVYLDTVASQRASARVRADTENALRFAHEHGAEVERISLAVDSAMYLIAAIVEQARQIQARRILLGNQATGRRFWATYGERLSDFSETLAASVPSAQIHMLVDTGRNLVAPIRTAGWFARRDDLSPGSWLLPICVLAACTAVGMAIADYLHPINLLLIFLVGVLYVALRQGRLAAGLTVLGAILLFDWMFVPPRWSLKPTDPEYFFTFAIMLGVGLAVSRLGVQTRESADRALALAHRSQALSLLAQNLARARTEADIVQTLVQAVERGLGARADVMVGDDPSARSAQPGSGIQFELVAGGARLGWLRVQELAPEHDSAEDMHLIQAFAHQAAVALERTRLAEQRAAAAVEAETERVRNTLLAGISHDFRTPLTTIIGAATTVLTQGSQISTAERDALARDVLEQAQRLQSLTSDLLDIARLQHGAVQPACEWCPADELVQDALAPLRPRLGSLMVDVQLDEDAIVWCDPRLLVQALYNLLLNASQHSPPDGRILVTVRLMDERWSLSVKDQGTGIAADQLSSVFQKFHRAGLSGGTGLGLAICDLVARLHGGHIMAQNDEGAVFEMTLPMPQQSRHPEERMDE